MENNICTYIMAPIMWRSCCSCVAKMPVVAALSSMVFIAWPCPANGEESQYANNAPLVLTINMDEEKSASTQISFFNNDTERGTTALVESERIVKVVVLQRGNEQVVRVDKLKVAIEAYIPQFTEYHIFVTADIISKGNDADYEAVLGIKTRYKRMGTKRIGDAP